MMKALTHYTLNITSGAENCLLWLHGLDSPDSGESNRRIMIMNVCILQIAENF